MREIIFTDPENNQGRIVHDYTDTGVPQETSGPIPPNAGDVREVYERLLADGVEPTPYTEPPVTEAMQRAARQAAYETEADPLFFKWQAGEGTEAEWLAKREEIRDRYPYPEEAE